MAILAACVVSSAQAAGKRVHTNILSVDADAVARRGGSAGSASGNTMANALSSLPASATASVPAARCDTTKLPTTAEAEALVRKIANDEAFYPDFVVAVAKVESRFHAEQVSPRGAIGLMQLMPATAARFRVDICDPKQNVRGGIRYLRALHERYRNPIFILSAYSAGEDAVDQYRGVPPFPETVRYVASVLNEFYAWPVPRPARLSSTGRAAMQPAAATGWAQGFVLHVEE